MRKKIGKKKIGMRKTGKMRNKSFGVKRRVLRLFFVSSF